jgi:hypothetical protein
MHVKSNIFRCVHMYNNNRDSAVGTVTGYGLDGRCSIPGRGKIFLFSVLSRLVLGPTPLLSSGYQCNLRGVKRQGREADHSPPSRAEFMNVGAIPPPPMCLHSILLN